jgi:hypothetical protein
VPLVPFPCTLSLPPREENNISGIAEVRSAGFFT